MDKKDLRKDTLTKTEKKIPNIIFLIFMWYNFPNTFSHTAKKDRIKGGNIH